MFDKILYKIHDILVSRRRSSKWESVQKKFLKNNFYCAACGATNKLNVHHILPFHVYPEYELKEENLITLCMSENKCHFLVGHGSSWKAYNPDVRTHARKLLNNECNKKNLIKKIKENKII